MSKVLKHALIKPTVLIFFCLFIYICLGQRNFFLYPQSISERSTNIFFFYDVVYRIEDQKLGLLEQCRKIKDNECFHLFKMLQKNRSEVFEWGDVKEYLVHYLKSKKATSFALQRKKVEPLSFYRSGDVIETVTVSEHIIE